MKTQNKSMRASNYLAVVLGVTILASCAREASSSTGWNYNDPRTGGFQKVPFVDQETGPGLILIEGGTFTMGRTEQDVMYDWNHRPTRVTVSSFYMDQTEVTNFHWLEYLYWISRAYETYPVVYKNALPDTLCWRSPLAFNEDYVEYYLRHPAYRDYPVVGVSWLQANDFCKWRTDRVNEYILIREGILGWNIDQRDENTFNTEAYYAGQYEEAVIRNVQDLNPSNIQGKRLGTRSVHWVRQDDEQFQGSIRANFVRGRGDYMGVAGNLNDGADITAPVESYWPNDYGLYHMAGNVSEWVLDVYRPLSSEDFDEFRPFRGNVFKTKVLNNEGSIDLKSQVVSYDVHGMKEYLNEFERTRYQRISADKHDPNDTVIPAGLSQNVSSRNPTKRGYAPDPFYVSHSKVKDSIELKLLRDINKVIDEAILMKNDKYDLEASALIQERLFEGIFADELRTGPQGEEYAFEIISMLREGFTDYIIDTPGKLRYRNVTEEENIGRLNYRRDDYVDYLDGDIESSIYYDNENRKNGINQAKRDPNLIMYQNEHEQYNLEGTPLKEGTVGWPTTLVSDKSRVYKGGSWRDRAYWLAAGSRRFLDEDKSTCTIGFRCTMSRVGSPTGINYQSSKKKK